MVLSIDSRHDRLIPYSLVNKRTRILTSINVYALIRHYLIAGITRMLACADSR